MEAADGVVVDTDRGHYAFQAPYVLLPDLAENEITDPLMKENYYAIMPIAQGLTVQDTESGQVTELLTTSELSFSKADGYGLSSYEKEEGDRTVPSRWLSRLRRKMRAGSSGLLPPIFWMKCIMPIHPGQIWIWP